MANEQKGVLLRVMKWSMTDETTGEIREGTTVTIGMNRTGSTRNPTKGFNIVKLSTPDTGLFERVDEKLTGKNVVVDCDLQLLNGGRAKFIPLTVQAA